MTKPPARTASARPFRPRNVAAQSLREGRFRPKVEEDPRAYRRKPKRRPDPLADPATDGDDGTGGGG